jgi:hypothetical protein
MLISTLDYFKYKIQTEYPPILTKLLKSVIPIIEYQKPFHYVAASCVYLMFNNKKVLVTASHAIKDPNDFLIPGKSKLERISGYFIRINSKSNRDTHDLFMISLNDVEANKLSHFIPTRISNSKCNIVSDTHYAFLGYPASKSEKFRHHANNFKSYSYVSYGIDEHDYNRFGYTPDYHILGKFEREDSLNINLNAMVFPSPKGMSGGGIWRIMSNSDLYSAIYPEFVGIIIEQSDNKKHLVGVKKNIILECIDKLLVI